MLFVFSSLLLRVKEETVGFLDLLDESVVVNQVLSDDLQWQVNKHTCDLWCSVFASQLLYEFVNEFSNLTLEVRVLWHSGGQQLSSLSVIGNNVGWDIGIHLNWKLSLDRNLCWDLLWNQARSLQLLLRVWSTLSGSWLHRLHHWWHRAWAWVRPCLLDHIVVVCSRTILVIVSGVVIWDSLPLASGVHVSLELSDEDLD